MNMSSIIWPEEAKAACNHYLTFILQVVVELEIVFTETRPDPRIVARRYIDGEISEEEYSAEAGAWWDFLDAAGETRGPRTRPAILARLAICLLSATPNEAPRLSDHLSWFLELLEKMGIDLHGPRAMMERHFVSSVAWRA
jgi:hypothetical protein